MEAPEVLRGAMMSSSALSIPQEFADSVIAAPVAASSDAAPACDATGGAAASAAGSAPGPVAMAAAADCVGGCDGITSSAMHVTGAAGAPGIGWSLRDTGGKYNIGTPEEPILHKAAPRMAAGVQSTQQQQIAHELKLHLGGK
jgi:hypothetical protein